MQKEIKVLRGPVESYILEKPVEAASPPPSRGHSVEPDDEDENQLREYWRAVRKHLWLISGITVLVTMLAAVYAARKPDIYAAQARVQVDLENNPAAGATSNGSSVIINNAADDPAYFNTKLQILTGPGLLRRVVKTLDLENNQAFLQHQSGQQRSTRESLRRMVGLGNEKQDGEQQGDAEELPLTGSVAPATSHNDLVEAKRLAPLVGVVKAGLKVEPVKETRTGGWTTDTRLIDISFTHPDPQMAAKIVNAVADTFVLSNLEKKTETNASAGAFLQRRVADLQSQIRSGEERLGNYAKNNQILSLDASQNMVVERLAGLNKQLLEAENGRNEAEAAYRAALAPGATSALAEKDAKGNTVEAESRLAVLEGKLAELLVENTDEWPEVKEVKQQIAVLKNQVSDTRGRAGAVITTNLETRYREALARERTLRAAFDRQRDETLAQNEAAINYRIIQQEIETNKTLLNGLLQRSKENDVVLAGTPNNIYVLDYALIPDAPTGPRRLRSVILALFLALSFGVGLSIFLEYLNDSVRSVEDVGRLLHLPALAVIPSVGGRSKRRRLSSAGVLEHRNGNGSPALLTNANPRSPFAEAYKHLRTSVLLSTAGHAPRTLLVTSSVPSEGKTTTAVNLATSLAQTGASVLLIDADMRRPRLQSIFDLENTSGLSTILSSNLSEVQILNLAVQHESSTLYLLTSGAMPPNPAELLSSEQMKKLLNVLKITFDHVVIDSPPIGSFTDGVIIAAMVDGVLLVVHGGKTPPQVLRRSRQLLQDVGSKIFGVVLNNVDLRSQDYYYKGYYQASYGQAEAKPDHAASGISG